MKAPAEVYALAALPVQKQLSHSMYAELAQEHHALTFTVGHLDLNDDGRPDLIIQNIWGSCGSSGCIAWVLLAGPGGYRTYAITPYALLGL